jgi:hypothetical protein
LSFLAGVVITGAVSYGANKGVAAAQAVVQQRLEAEITRRLDSIDKKIDRFDEDVRELHSLFTEICARLGPWDGNERRHGVTTRRVAGDS